MKKPGRAFSFYAGKIMNQELKELEKKIGYTFKVWRLLKKAMLHRFCK